MPRKIEIKGLEIIAYADKLSSEFVPKVVPPIFYNPSEKVIIPPPFHLEGEFVSTDNVIGGYQDYETMIKDWTSRFNITLINPKIPAQPNHELWIDEKMKPHYDTFEEAERIFLEKSKDYCRQGLEHLTSGNLKAARKSYGRALCADDRRSEPLAGLIALSRLTNHLECAISLERTAMADGANLDPQGEKVTLKELRARVKFLQNCYKTKE